MHPVPDPKKVPPHCLENLTAYIILNIDVLSLLAFINKEYRTPLYLAVY